MKVLAILLVGAALRAALFLLLPSSILDSLRQRVELSTPFTSHKRLEECLYLLDHQYPLYDGGLCHHPPLLVHLFNALRSFLPSNIVPVYILEAIIYTLLDTLLGLLIYRLARLVKTYSRLFNPTWAEQVESVQARPAEEEVPSSGRGRKKREGSLTRLSKASAKKEDGPETTEPSSPSPTDFSFAPTEAEFKKYVLDKEHISPLLTVALYMLNPFMIASCLSKSTVLFSNFTVAAAFYFSCKGHGILAMLWLALATYLSFYPWMLVIPMILVLRKSYTVRKGHTKDGFLVLYAPYFWMYTFWMTVILVISLVALSSGNLGPLIQLSSKVPTPDELFLFLRSEWMSTAVDQLKRSLIGTYGFILSLNDLSPTIGLYWYFFTEFFDSFRPFFVVIVQLLIASFMMPSCIKFRHDPCFTVCLIMGVIAYFKSYPSLGDGMFWLTAILPIQQKLYKFQRAPFLSFNLLLFSVTLLPAFHFIWIYAGSGNANFFYAITLLWGLGGVWLLNDLIYAWIRRTFELYIYSNQHMKIYRGIEVVLK